MGLQRIDEGAVVTLWVLIGGVDRGAGTSLSIALITTTSFRNTSPKCGLPTEDLQELTILPQILMLVYTVFANIRYNSMFAPFVSFRVHSFAPNNLV